MDYFILKQDERYKNTPRLLNVFKEINVKDINLLNAHKIEDIIVLRGSCEEGAEFLDLLDNQLFLISNELKKIIEKYDRDIIFKMIAIIDSVHQKQGNYCLPIFNEIEALSDKSELNLNKTVVKKVVLDKEKVKGKKIFKLKESSKTLIIVRLDVAESLLRRGFKGIKLERVDIE